MLHNLHIGFIGAGNMGSALVKGIIHKEVIDKERVTIYDVQPDKCRVLAENCGVSVAESEDDLIRCSDIVVLSVKPQTVAGLLTSVGKSFTREHVLISVAAGISLHKLENLLGAEIPVIRVLPNMPSLIGRGVSVISPGSHAGPREEKIAQEMMSGVGAVLQVSEKEMDAVTSLSGSGPAYIFLILEALTDAGVRVGLSREIAGQLALHTLIGAGEMVKETEKTPEELRAMVSSPGGTTITGIHSLEKSGVRGAIMDAVVAACTRAGELGRES